MSENSYLQSIADALTENADNKNNDAHFCIEQQLEMTNIRVNVESVGMLTLPLTNNEIEKIISLSSKAKFGLREKTLLDESIRDTYEITADQLQVTIDETAMASLMKQVADELGVAEGATITPHLHNMLIYEPGQFFKKHQDSEKLENMVATLVVILPSPHIGGDLVVEHAKKNYVFSSENIDARTAKCLAFYADCAHQVERVKQGYRVALTYNLVLASPQIQLFQKSNAQLKEAVQSYFDIEENAEPLKLAYFLEHSYTEHSLKWEMLKGSDRINATSLLSVARELNLLSHLALVEIHESWTTDGDDNDPSPEELIDEDMTLSYWTSTDNKILPYASCDFSEDEICFKTETKDLEPDETDYEGYMGNYGDTMDYWYRRTAIVLWRQSDQITMNFKLNYDAALSELESLTHVEGNEQLVVNTVKKAGDFLIKSRYHIRESSFIPLLNMAIYIKDEEIALNMLSQFNWNGLNSDCADSVLKLHAQYGADWCIQLLTTWKKNGDCRPLMRSSMMLENVDRLIYRLVKGEINKALPELVLATQSTALIEHDKNEGKYQKPVQLKESLSERIANARQFLQACSITSLPNASENLVAHLITNPTLYPELELANLYLDLTKSVSEKSLDRFKPLKEYLVQAINTQLASGLRTPDDWSIRTKLSCQCKHCDVAGEFLSSSTEIKKIWPIIAEIRDHVTNTFRGLDLPVDLSVEKKGSPHKLVMVKNEKLHHDAYQKFNQLQALASQMDSPNE